MSNCVENCGTTGHASAAVSNIQRVYELMAPLVDSGIGLQYLEPVKGYGLTRFLFDVEYIDGNEVLKLKSGLGRIGVNPKVDPDGCAVAWYEMATTSRETSTTAELAIGDTSLVVEDATVFGNLTDDHVLSLNVGTGVFKARVDSVDYNTNTITLKAGPSVAIPSGTCAAKLSYNRPEDCVSNIENTGTIGYNKALYRSHFRNIEVAVKFDQNTDCTLAGYTYADALGMDTAVEFLKQKKNEVLVELYTSLLNAIYYDGNFGKGENPSFPESSQTMGLITQLDKVQNDGVATTFDFATQCCADADDCDGIENSIKAFKYIVNNLKKSGAYATNKVIIGANEKQIELLQDMLSYFEAHAGRIVTVDRHTGGALDLGYDIYDLKIGTTMVEFRYAPEFDNYDVPYMLAMPENTMMMFYDNRSVNYNANEFKFEDQKDNSLTAAGLPNFEVTDRTPYIYNGLDGCAEFAIRARIAVVWAFTDKGAYMRMFNFGSCLPESCYSCTTSGTVSQIIDEA